MHMHDAQNLFDVKDAAYGVIWDAVTAVQELDTCAFCTEVWFEEDRLLKQLEKVNPALETRWYLDVGTEETSNDSVHGDLIIRFRQCHCQIAYKRIIINWIGYNEGVNGARGKRCQHYFHYPVGGSSDWA